MFFGSCIYNNLKFSRPLSESEQLEFNQLYHLQTSETRVYGDQILNLGFPFDNYNLFKVDSNSISISNDSPYLYLEVIFHLLQTFFYEKDVYVNGYLIGYDNIFGEVQSFYIHNNQIYIVRDLNNHFEKVQNDIPIENLDSYMKDIIKKMIL